MRAILGSIDVKAFSPVYKDYLNRLQRSKELSKFKFGNKYLVALDATQYYSSSKISCSCCLTKTDKKGKITNYSHSALQPIICHPDQKQILPMMPEDIKTLMALRNKIVKLMQLKDCYQSFVIIIQKWTLYGWQIVFMLRILL